MKNQPCLYLLLLLLAASCVQDVKTISSRVNYLLSRKSEVCGTRLVKFQPQRSPKIVGGTPAPYGAFPWQVILFLKISVNIFSPEHLFRNLWKF